MIIVNWIMIFRQLFDKVSSTYTYFIASDKGREALIIDPVLENVEIYIQLLKELNLKLVKVIDTHIHADHITAASKLKNDELNDTYWEVETGEFLKGQDVKEIEEERDTLIKFLTSKDEANETIATLCKNYEKLCKEKYPEAPLPLEILDN